MTNIKSILQLYFHNHLNGGAYTIFLASIIIYSLGFLSYTSEHVISQLSLLIMILGLVGMGFSFIKLVSLNISNSYLKIIFILFILWQLFIITRGIEGFNFTMLLNLLFSPYYFLHYLVPLILLIPANIFFAKKMFNFFAALSVLLFVVFALFSNEMLHKNLNFSEQAIWTLGTGAGFLLLTWRYHKNSRRVIAFLTVILALIVSTIMARRNIMLTFSNFLLFSLVISILSASHSIRSKFYLVTVFIFTTAFAYYIYINNQDKLFGKISGHLTENTRGIVIDAFLKDMSTKDMVIGKGFLGEYYCPGAEQDKDYRFLIESGYLQTILKGGIISLALFLLIALPAAYLGIVKSNNILSKASGTIVILWLIDMVPWGMPAINIRYILVWICISVCYSKVIRNLSDTEIQNSLLLRTR